MKKSKQNYKPGLKDLCQTPGYALAPILPALHKLKEEIEKTSLFSIYECAAGEGYLWNTLISYGFNTINMDLLYTGNDFLNDNLNFIFHVIVTNPPFSLKYDFFKRCYELDKPFALLMPVDVFGSKKGQQLMSQYGGTCILMDKRINFKMPNKGWEGSGSDFSVAWFTKGLFPDEYPNYRLQFYSYDWLTAEKRKEFEV